MQMHVEGMGDLWRTRSVDTWAVWELTDSMVLPASHGIQFSSAHPLEHTVHMWLHLLERSAYMRPFAALSHCLHHMAFIPATHVSWSALPCN